MRNMITILSLMVLVGTEVFAAAIAAAGHSPVCSTSATRSATS